MVPRRADTWPRRWRPLPNPWPRVGLEGVDEAVTPVLHASRPRRGTAPSPCVPSGAPGYFSMSASNSYGDFLLSPNFFS